MSNSDIQNDPRFTDAKVGKINPVSDNGVVSVEDRGDGVVALTDRDGRVFVETLADNSVDEARRKQQQKVVDTANEFSPVNTDPNRVEGPVAPDVSDDAEVVNQDLGIDNQDKE